MGRPCVQMNLKEVFAALKLRIQEEFGKDDVDRNIASIKIDFSIDPTKTIEKDLEISIRQNKSIDLELNLTSAKPCNG